MSLINHSTFPALDRFQRLTRQPKAGYHQMAPRIPRWCGEAAPPQKALIRLETRQHSGFRTGSVPLWLNLMRFESLGMSPALRGPSRSEGRPPSPSFYLS